MGVERSVLFLGCRRRGDQEVQFKLYDREKPKSQLRSLGGEVP